MGWRMRWLQAVALAVFLATAFLPVHGPTEHPGARASPLGNPRVLLAPERQGPVSGAVEVPAALVWQAAVQDLAGSYRGSRLWEARRWYPYVLAPLWLLALFLARGSGPAARTRRERVGLFLIGVSVALVVLEAVYLGEEYAVLFPQALGRSEVVIAWLLVVALLTWRRKRDRSLAAVEGHVGSQALLSCVHMLTLPSSEMRPWLGQFPLDDVLATIIANFHAAFWLGSACLAVAVAAAYGKAPSRLSERGHMPDDAKSDSVDPAADVGRTTPHPTLY